MDISSLTNLITAFRAETRQNSITPDTLGLLLQKIVNVLENAAEYTTVQQLEDWEGSLTGLGSVLTKIGLGSDDRNNIYLNIGSVNTKTGIGMLSAFTLRQATTERAGVMRAQQVTDLNSVRNKMQHLATLHMEVAASAASVQLALKENNGDVFNSPSSLSVSLPVASSAQAGILSAEDYKKFSTVQAASGAASTRPFYRIECDAKGDDLLLSYPSELTALGYVPYLLRYTVKRSRYRFDRDKPRVYGPLKRGWHMFYGPQKIKVSARGEVTFGRNVGSAQRPGWEYVSDKRFLFGAIRGVSSGGSLKGYKIGFGTRTHLITTNHRFRFGIVFAPPLSGSNQTLNFAKVVTNIARFQVHVQKTGRAEYDGMNIKFVYCI